MPARSLLFAFILLALPAAPAFAQFSGGGATYDAAHHAYFVQGNATLNGDVSGNDIFVGKDNSRNFATLNTATPVTLTITSGATATYNSIKPYRGDDFTGVNVFGKNKVNITGGDIREIRGYDFSAVNITGGNVDRAFSMASGTTSIHGGTLVSATAYGSSTTNFSGGRIHDLSDEETSTTNVSGGTIEAIDGFNTSITNICGGNIDIVEDNDNSITNISGGTIGAILLRDSSRLNLLGAGLSLSDRRYRGGDGIDIFTIIGRLRDGTVYSKTRPLQIFIENGTGRANPTPRQFTFNGIVPPEKERTR